MDLWFARQVVVNPESKIHGGEFEASRAGDDAPPAALQHVAKRIPQTFGQKVEVARKQR